MTSNSESQNRDYSVRAVERVAAVLDLLQASPGEVSLAEVADATELPKSSAFRYLWTLESYRYVERNPTSGAYRLGPRLASMQSGRIETLRERAAGTLSRLRDETGETINLGRLDRDAVVYIDIVESPRAVRLAVKPNEREQIHCTALGKVLAAQLPEHAVSDILERSGMAARTERTITDPGEYMTELARVRRLGYALDNGENEEDGRCVAVPIEGGELQVALSLSAPSSRFRLSDVEEAVGILQAGAAAIAYANAHS